MSRVYVTTVPGLGRILEGEAKSLGLTVTGRGNDGRADVLGLGRSDLARLRELRTAENVLLHVADVPLRTSLSSTVGQLPQAAVRSRVRELGGNRVRLVVRLLDERHFTRTALRNALARHLAPLVARAEDASALELWVFQATRSHLWLGMRHPRLGTRARPARPVELPAALRSAVAAAMVRLAGDGASVLDPCSGSGTIAAEAMAVQRHVVAGDLDPRAVAATRRNVGVPVLRLDARRLPFEQDFGAVVTNLPFGRQHLVQGAPVAWYRRVLTEALRVAPQAVVLAAPTQPFRQALGRLPVTISSRYDLELLGNRTAIWVLARNPSVTSATRP